MDLMKNRLINIEHQFSDSEWRCVEIFNRRTTELVESRAKLEPKLITMKIHRPSPGKFEADGNFPDKDQLIDFYRLFRFFVLKKEDSFFFRVANIASKNAPNDEVRTYIRCLKRQWNLSASDDLLVWLGREQMKIEEVVDPWFNAYYFHSDRDQEPKLEELIAYFGETLAEWLLYQFIFTACHAVVNLHKAISNFERDRYVFEVDLFLLDHFQARGWM